YPIGQWPPPLDRIRSHDARLALSTKACPPDEPRGRTDEERRLSKDAHSLREPSAQRGSHDPSDDRRFAPDLFFPDPFLPDPLLADSSLRTRAARPRRDIPARRGACTLAHRRGARPGGAL